MNLRFKKELPKLVKYPRTIEHFLALIIKCRDEISERCFEQRKDSMDAINALNLSYIKRYALEAWDLTWEDREQIYADISLEKTLNCTHCFCWNDAHESKMERCCKCYCGQLKKNHKVPR